MFHFMATSRKSKMSPQLTLFVEEPLAKHSQSLDNGEGWLTLGGNSLLSLDDLPNEQMLAGSSGKTFPVSSVVLVDGILASSSGRWQTQGIVSLGVSWTRNGSDCPSDGKGSLLSDIVQPMEASLDRFCLTPKAATGILRRAQRRGKILPEPLVKALQLVAQEATSTE
jgi:hypothetical protein